MKMLTDFYSYLKKLMRDNLRLFLPVVITTFLLSTFDMFPTIGVTTVIPLAAAIYAHFLRKVLFPNLKLHDYMELVKEENSLAAAIVIFGVLLFTLTLIIFFSTKIF